MNPRRRERLRERLLAVHAARVAQQLAYHKQRVDGGFDPRCGLRLMTPDSATVVPKGPMGCASPFASFSLDSRDPEIYALAAKAARELVAYAEASA